MKEKADLLQKGDKIFLGKKFRSHIVETERYKKRKLEVFSSGSLSPPTPAKKPFRTEPSASSNKPFGGGRFYSGKKTNNRDRKRAI